MKATFNPQTTDIRLVEAEGFRAGANHVPKDPSLKELDGTFDRRKAEVREASTPKLKALEALAQTLTIFAAEAGSRWKALQEEHNKRLPRLFLPLLFLVGSGFAVTAEAYLIAPLLDMLGIANPAHQLWTAAAIVTVAALIFHHYLTSRENSPQAMLPVVLAAATVLGLTVLGIMRANQLAFAETLSGNPLGQFLQGHPWFGEALSVFLTLFFPIAAAVALHEALAELHSWWEFRKARNQATRLTATANQTQKTLEAKREELAQQIDQLSQQAKEWKAAYCNFYELGAAVGAKRQPRWIVWAKAAAVAILILGITLGLASILWGPLQHVAFLLSGLLAVGAWFFAAIHFYRKWEHPSPAEYLKLARLRFHDDQSTKGRGARTLPPAVVPPEGKLLRQVAAPGDGRGQEVN